MLCAWVHVPPGSDFEKSPLALAYDSETKTRLSNIRCPAVANSIAITHTLARYLLARETGSYLEDIHLTHDCPRCGSSSHGVPSVAGLPPSEDWIISLSHCNSMAMVAIAERETPNSAIGVDVESVRKNVFWQTHADRLYSKDEVGILAPEFDSSACTQLWTRKEAVVKALGIGLSVDLREVQVDTNPGRCRNALGQLMPMPFFDIDVGPDHRASVAGNLDSLEVLVISHQRLSSDVARMDTRASAASKPDQVL